MLPPLPRCSSWVYSSLISPSRISLPRFHYRVGLHIVLFEVCPAFTHVAACTLARSPIRDRYPGASDISSPPCLPRLLPAGANRRVGLAPTGKAPPCHSPTSYFILRNINLLRHNIQILTNMVSRSARRRPPLCVAAQRALIFEGWVRGPEFTHADYAVDIDNGIGWTVIVVATGHRHYGGVVTRLRRPSPRAGLRW